MTSVRNDSENGGQISFVSGRPESGVPNDDDAELTFNAIALLPHNFAIAYLGIPFREGDSSIKDTF